MALQNARDVFVRRPQTYRLWVVPAEVILARTAQEMQQAAEWESETTTASETEREYHVFRKTNQRRSMTYVELAEEIVASSPSRALRQAMERVEDDETTYVWWIVPADAVVASTEEDVESMFEPARDKTYRLPGEYRTTTMMREVRSGRDED
jgi:1,2-phenylacetyl-CoA epoxidase PaaB subunit